MSKPREWFVFQMPQSNQALIRDPGEKWHSDIKGEPAPEWINVIEKTPYVSECLSMHEALIAKCDGLENRRSIREVELLNRCKELAEAAAFARELHRMYCCQDESFEQLAAQVGQELAKKAFEKQKWLTELLAKAAAE